MSFADTYIRRFQVLPPQIAEPPVDAVGIILVMPCYYEPDVLKSLLSICNCSLPQSKVEVIIVVNHSESDSDEVKRFNDKTYQQLCEFSAAYSNRKIAFYPLYCPNLSVKQAGVGLARKIGLDEAVYRFDYLNKPHGIISCCDADSLFESNFLTALEEYYASNPKVHVATHYFEHPLQGDLSPAHYQAIAQYELHLRYYVQALTFISFPYAYHTVGSSCSLRAIAYCRQGGMNKRQAGEDFYFLQKLFQNELVGEIQSTTVYPASRESHRVPFGTGFAMHTLMKSTHHCYYSYHPQSFHVLDTFFQTISVLFVNTCNQDLYNSLHESFRAYISYTEFSTRIAEIRSNSSTEQAFRKRFFTWFNGFQVFKFLNFAHTQYFTKLPIVDAASILLEINSSDVFHVLHEYRTLQRSR